MSFNVHIHVHVTVDTVRQFVKALEQFESQEVVVGVPEEKAPRNHTELEGRRGEPANNALIAYVQNFGHAALGIPAREFMESGIELKRDELEKEMFRTGQDVLDGKRPTTGFHRVGLTAQNGIRERIGQNLPPPLKPGTLAARRHRGRTGTMTLQDTGQLRNSMTYVIRKRDR